MDYILQHLEFKTMLRLYDELIERGVNPLYIEREYLSKESGLRFDLVVLDKKKHEISEIYEVCTYTAVRNNRNYILKKLRTFEEIVTNAKCFLAYIDPNNDEIKIESIEDLKGKPRPVVILTKKGVSSFGEFYEIIKKKCKDETYDSQYFFRGHADVTYECLPSIFRNPNHIKNENAMFHEAERLCPSAFPKEMSTIDKLAKMQHYGLPTRLLDITKNPLVALYFACCDEKDKDAEVLIFSVPCTKFFDSDTVSVVANLAKRPSKFTFDRGKDYLLYDIRQEKNGFEDCIIEDHLYSVICVLPKRNSDRITQQSGAFFLFGMSKKGGKTKPAEFLDKPIRIKIKAGAKGDILKELAMLGITEATLFPEEDKIMKSIKTMFDK